MRFNKVRFGPGFIIFVFFLSFYMLICRGDFYAIDEMGRYGLAKTIVLERDLTLTRPSGASTYVPWPILQPVLAVPFFAAGYLLAKGGPVAKEEAGRLLVAFFNPFIGALSCLVFYRLCLRLHFSRYSSMLGSLVFGFCTILLPYSRTFLSEPLTGLLLMSALLFALKSSRGHPYPAFFTGLLLALAAANNYVAITAFAIVFIYFMVQEGPLKDVFGFGVLKDIRLWILPVFGLMAFLWVSWYDNLIYGSFIGERLHFFKTAPNVVYPNGMSGFSYPMLAGIYGFLLSPGDSIFLFSPPLLAALIAWPRFLKERGRPALAILAIPLVYLLIHSKFGDWWGGYSWGPRFLVPVTGFLLLPFVCFVEDFARLRNHGRILLIGTVLFGLYVQMVATVLPPVAGYVKMLRFLGGDSFEMIMQYLPQACPVALQTQDLKTITSLSETDLYFLKNLDSSAAVLVFSLFLAVFLVATFLYWRTLRSDAGAPQKTGKGERPELSS